MGKFIEITKGTRILKITINNYENGVARRYYRTKAIIDNNVINSISTHIHFYYEQLDNKQ